MKKFFLLAMMFLSAVPAFASECHTTPYSAKEIQRLQKLVADRPVGSRIAFWAERFVGVPYDADPLGRYVRKKSIVTDREMDCMYLVFRSVELALSRTPEGAVKEALDLRFRTKGKLDKDGNVLNYDDRFQYAEDMIASGKWGKDITTEIGPTKEIPGSRGYKTVEYIPKAELMKEKYYSRLRNGDIIYFIKDPRKRVVGEIVGHLGIITWGANLKGPATVYLINASGTKTSAKYCGGGMVKKVPLVDYLSKTGFIGAKFTRF
ncbi:MAG: hypothetical protein ACYDFU_03310 [Nitrospirota bacterium]